MKMALVTNKNTNHLKLKTCTYGFEKKYLKFYKHNKCYHEVLKTYISKFDTMK
jgi:hypothetical protein